MTLRNACWTVLSFVTALSMSSCSGGSQVASTPEPRIKSQARMMVPQRRDLDLDEALGLLAQSEPGPGVDNALWQQLTEMLANALTTRSEGKLTSIRPTGSDNQLVDLAIVDDGLGGQLIEWTYINVGDYDLNGEVGLSDLTPIVLNYSKNQADPDWGRAQLADGDGNGEVNLADVTPIAVHYAMSCNGYNIYGRNGTSGPYTLLDTVARDSVTADPRYHYSWPITGAAYEHYVVAAYDFEGDDRPIYPIVNDSAVVLEDSGMGITSKDGTTVTLSGDTSALVVGQAMVSGEGEGFLGIVESIDDTGAETVVTYSQGNFTHLFDYAEVNFKRSLGFADMESYTPGIEGVVVESTGGTASVDGKGSSVSGHFKIKLPDRDLILGLKVQGEIELKIAMDFGLQIGTNWTDFGDLKRLYWETEVEVKGTPVIAWKGDSVLTDRSWMIAEINMAPIAFMAGPIPVVIIPQVEIHFGVKGTVEVGLEFKPSFTVEASAGFEYTSYRGFEPFSDYDYDWDIGLDKPNLYGKFIVDFNLFTPQPTLSFYGADGPYAKFFAPYLKVVGQLQTTPPEFSLTGWLGMKGTVGADLNALGYELANYESDNLFDVMLKVYERKWPLVDHEMVVSVDWVVETEDAMDSLPGKYNRDKSYVDRVNMVWYMLDTPAQAAGVGEWDPGSLEEAPFALWDDVRSTDEFGNPVSGTTTIYYSQVYKPAIHYLHVHHKYKSWPVVFTNVTVSGEVSGSRSFGPEYAFYSGEYAILRYETETGELLFLDPEGGYDTPWNNNITLENGTFPHLAQ